MASPRRARPIIDNDITSITATSKTSLDCGHHLLFHGKSIPRTDALLWCPRCTGYRYATGSRVVEAPPPPRRRREPPLTPDECRAIVNRPPRRSAPDQ